ncbi:cytochrome c-type biogenesis protein CcmH [Rhizobium rhizogenes]|uniref:Cytochrome c-type biogenesis protein n=2 Tax=Rhizobiaceae TaxID=82115 RepID=A0A546XNY7_RHIRH|nr:cytochrome c-type biogenesis protein CcmH [Rhizobium rhizogenes]
MSVALSSFLCLSQESSRRASARRESFFSPRTWAGWIPVTSTGMRKIVAGLTLLLALLFAPWPAFAFNPDEVLKDPVLEQRARNLTSQLRCMVCQNQSIDDSNAELARDLRVLVRERLVQGDSDKAVIDYVVSRYGEFVLLKPRLSLRTVLLWGAPVGLTLAGIFAVFVFSRRRATQERPQKLSADEEERIRNLIEK